MKRITLNGTKYHIDLAGEIDGCVDITTSNTPTLMLCRSDLSSRAYMETVVHEALHACFSGATEEKVTQCSKDITRLLWGLGYRYKEGKR